MNLVPLDCAGDIALDTFVECWLAVLPLALGGPDGRGLVCAGVLALGEGSLLADPDNDVVPGPEEIVSCCEACRGRIGVGAFGKAGVATEGFGEAKVAVGGC